MSLLKVMHAIGLTNLTDEQIAAYDRRRDGWGKLKFPATETKAFEEFLEAYTLANMELGKSAATHIGEVYKQIAATTVLLVEQDESTRVTVRSTLADVGFHVMPATTGRRAEQLAAAVAAPIHILLTDIQMPDMTGQDLAARLRVFSPGLQVIYLVGTAENVEGSVLKPIESSTLLAAMAGVVARTRPLDSKQGESLPKTTTH